MGAPHLLAPGPGEAEVDLPPGRWALFGSLRRLQGPCRAPAATYQREGTVVARQGEGGELQLYVAAGGRFRTRLEDGTEVELDGDRLRVRGPERDVLVVVDGRFGGRARGAEVEFDLHPATALVAWGDREPADPRPLGWPFGGWERVGEARSREDRDGVAHRYEVCPQPPLPEEPAAVRVAAPPTVQGLRVRVLEPAPALLPARWSGRWWEATLPPYPGETVVRYRVEHAGGVVAEAAPAFVYPDVDVPFARPPRDVYTVVPCRPRLPGWVEDAVLYHVLVDRFTADGRPLSRLGFAGGTLARLAEQLDHVAELGADTLLVSPIFPAETNVCYDVKDLFSVEPRLGTVEDAKALCARAHELGLRVLLDIELCYLGWRHPFVRSALADPASRYREWFFWLDDERPYGWFGSRVFVPLDHSRPAVREHLLEAVRFWLDVGFDGFRLDAAHAGSLGFWAELGRELRLRAPEAFTVGEVLLSWEECLRLRGRLHGFFDFGVAAALRRVVGTGEEPVSALDAEVARRDGLPKGLVALPFIENHDMDRFEAVAGGDRRRLRLALLLLLTLPGPPVLYYGTEVGLGQPAGTPFDEGARLPMVWGPDQDRELLGYVRRLVALRRAHPALRRGVRRTLLACDRRGLYAYERTLGDDRVLVVANLSAHSRVARVEGERVRLRPLSGAVLPAHGDGGEVLVT